MDKFLENAIYQNWFFKKTGNLINSSIMNDIKTIALKFSNPVDGMIPETYI